MIKHLPWDSDFFNLNIASVDATHEVADIELQEFDMFYSFHSEENKVFKNFQPTFREHKIIFLKSNFLRCQIVITNAFVSGF